MKNNAFEKHHIDHLSATTINLFISQPAMCLLKLSGYRSEVGASAWRGSAVDKTLTNALSFDDMTEDIAISNAKKLFDEYQNDSKIDPEKVKKELSITERCIKSAFWYLLPDYRGKELIGSQGKIEVMLDDVPVPFVGYYDWLFADKVVDLKTKGQRTNNPDTSHKRQLALYEKATGKKPYVVYISPNEVKEFSIDDSKNHLENMRTAALALEKILSFSDDIEECCRLLYPDFDHWIWSEQDQTQAKKIWRIK
mgnify:CR=1 FL=1